MGQKVNPISNRLGIVRGWDSNWFGGKDFGDNLVEDQKIRKYLNERLAKASVSKIVIERTLKLVTITIPWGLKELDTTEQLSLSLFSLKGNLKYVKSRIS